jgi:hypothetical protein
MGVRVKLLILSIQSEAQKVYDTCIAEVGKDIHRLDSDNDGEACESLN